MQLDVIQPEPQPAAPKPCCARAEAGELGWTCPMHPQVTRSTPGTCELCGMPLVPIGAEADAAPRQAAERRRLGASTLLGVLLVVVAMGPMLAHMLPAVVGGHALAEWFARLGLTGPAGHWVQLALATPLVFWGGWPILAGGLAGFRAGRPGMFSLVTLGVLASWLCSTAATIAPGIFPDAFRQADGTVPVSFESAGMIVVLVLAGQALESRARRGTAAAIRALMDLSPPTAERVGSVRPAATGTPSCRRATAAAAAETIPLAAVVVGDLLRVTPGGAIPVDGIVREGATACDESLVTGEPLPVAKRPGDRVLGGSLGGSGAIVIEATAVAADSLVARITRLVREAHARRAPIENLADRVAAWFVPAVLAMAALTFAAWAAFGPRPRLALGLVSAVSVLVIACPCALGLATPLAMTVAIGRAAREGILARSAAAVERLAAVGTVVFDKTGTLTQGRPRIVAARTIGGDGASGPSAIADGPDFDREPLRGRLAVAAAVEAAGGHALGRAFTAAAAAVGLDLPEARDVRAEVGLGVRGVVEGREVLVGSGRFMDERRVVMPAAARLAEPAGTAVYLAENGRPTAAFLIADEPRPEAQRVVSQLVGRGLAVEVLSGDSPAAARRVADAVGITAAGGGLSPADKAGRVAALVAGSRTGAAPAGSVVFVGDGINDAPALAAADVGIAMGSGADVALETADVTLLSGGLDALVRGIDLAGDTMRVVRQNLALAFLYNVLAVPLAAGAAYPLVGHVTSPMLAAAAMTLSSLSVIANSLRLRSPRASSREPAPRTMPARP